MLLDVLTYISDNAYYVPDHIRKIKLVWLVQSPIKHSHKTVINETRVSNSISLIELSKKMKKFQMQNANRKNELNPNL